MTEASEHPYVELIVNEARRSVDMDPAARDRLMALVRMEPAPRRRSNRMNGLRRVNRVRDWFRVPSLALSPAAGIAFAAGLVGVGVFAGALYSHRDGRSAGTSPKAVGQPPVVAVSNPQLPVSDTVVQFIVMAPRASAVSLVGDFNGWNAAATPMRPTARSGVWSVTLPLAQGRHLYAYIVNGSQWMADPGAPIASDDGFGHKNSVILVRPGAVL